MDLHLIPGHFSDAAAKLLVRLGVQIEHVEPGDSCRKTGQVSLPGRAARPVGVELHGAHPAGRLLVGVSFEDSPLGGDMTVKDLEIGLLGLACAAVGGEDQGVVAIGAALGPVGVAIPRGTLAEQGRALVSLHGPSMEVLVACPDTAASLGDLAGYVREPLGDLVTYRLI